MPGWEQTRRVCRYVWLIWYWRTSIDTGFKVIKTVNFCYTTLLYIYISINIYTYRKILLSQLHQEFSQPLHVAYIDIKAALIRIWFESDVPIRKFRIGRTCRHTTNYTHSLCNKTSTFAPFVVEFYVYNSALTLLFRRQEGHPAGKKDLVLVCWWWWFDWSFARPIAPAVTTTSIILCFDNHWLTQVHLENGR